MTEDFARRSIMTTLSSALFLLLLRTTPAALRGGRAGEDMTVESASSVVTSTADFPALVPLLVTVSTGRE